MTSTHDINAPGRRRTGTIVRAPGTASAVIAEQAAELGERTCKAKVVGSNPTGGSACGAPSRGSSPESGPDRPRTSRPGPFACAPREGAGVSGRPDVRQRGEARAAREARPPHFGDDASAMTRPPSPRPLSISATCRLAARRRGRPARRPRSHNPAAAVAGHRAMVEAAGGGRRGPARRAARPAREDARRHPWPRVARIAGLFTVVRLCSVGDLCRHATTWGFFRKPCRRCGAAVPAGLPVRLLAKGRGK